MQPVVELNELSKSYAEGNGRRQVLAGLSGQFLPGRIHLIVGRSGAGKSTLLNLISGIDRPDQGSVIINGEDLSGLSETRRTLFRRHHIGIVFQFFNLIPTLSVNENLLLPLELIGVTGAAARQRIDDLLGQVGLADRLDSFPDQLSGGEQQRVALVRALVHQPEVILADEPTGNLDRETGEAVMDLLVSLVREQGRSLVLVSHSPDARRHADEVMVLGDGRLHLDGPGG